MDKLPELAKRLIYEYDDTYKEKFKDVMWELKTRMKRRYIEDPTNTKKTIHKNEIFSVTEWDCVIKLRRKSKLSKYLIKKNHTIVIRGDMIYPLEHNRNAHNLDAKNQFKEYRNNNLWSSFVRHYLSQTNYLITVLKLYNGRMLRITN